MTQMAMQMSMQVAMPLSASAQQLLPYQNANLSAEERANDLLSRLTLEEKTKLMMDTSPAIARLGIRFNGGTRRYTEWGETVLLPFSLSRCTWRLRGTMTYYIRCLLP